MAKSMLAQRHQGRPAPPRPLAKPTKNGDVEGDGGEFQPRKVRLAEQKRFIGSPKPDSRLVGALLSGDKAISDTMQVDAFVLGIEILVEKGRYDRLEELYASYRDSKARFANGTRKSTIFFYAAKKPRVEGKRAAWLPQQLVEWQKARPNSALPRVAMARLLMDATEGAWNADVGGLPEPLRSYMRDPMASSRQLLEEAADLAPDADIYALLIDQVRREGGSAEDAQAYVDLVDQLDPSHYIHEAQLARLLQSRRGDWRTAISRPENGSLTLDTYVKDPKNAPKVLLPYLQAGEKAFPKSAVLKNKLAKVAMKARDYELAAKKFSELGDRCESSVWQPSEFFRERNKLEQMGYKVRTGAFFPLPSNPAELADVVPDMDLLLRQSAELFGREQYAELDALADALRAKNARFPNHLRKISAIYEGVLDESLNKDVKPWERSVMVQRWLRLRPKSVMAGTLAVRAAVDEAWEIRGSGWASSVSPSQWEGFRERLATAQVYFRELEAMPGTKDPEAYAHAITVAMGQGADRGEVDALLAKARKVDPLASLPYRAAANYLLPRWMGSQQELEDFLATVPAEILGEVVTVASEDVDTQDKTLRKRILRGRVALAERFSTVDTWSAVLTTAVAYEDRATAARAISALGGSWSPNYVMSPKTYQRYVAWSKGGAL